MAPLNPVKLDAPRVLILWGLLLLATGMLFGVTGALQYSIPGFFKSILSFEKIRPLHVSSVVFWILFAATGSVLVYLRERSGKELPSGSLARIQTIVFVVASVAVLGSYVMGYFGGREYWEFPPPLALLLLGGWILFAIQVVKAVRKLTEQPVYIWMWLTGAIGFLFTFSESYLWVFQFFQKNLVHDMTVQWKSYGSIVGCWNMLVYGLGFFLMEKISGDGSYARSPMAFALFFLGLFNLMFNWSHHIYTLPVASAIRHVGYVVSMTELLILGRIIYKWKDSVSAARRNLHRLPYVFLVIADFWVFLNLILAIAISVPAINVLTHGTHITVAHVMGTTIGINTMMLLAVAYDIVGSACLTLEPYRKTIQRAAWVVNVALATFLGVLFTMGWQRGKWQIMENPPPFSQFMYSLAPYHLVFALSGIVLFAGLCFLIFPAIKVAVLCHVRAFRKTPARVNGIVYGTPPHVAN